MEFLFSVNPSIVIGILSAAGCLYFLLICAEETKALLAYKRDAQLSLEPLARHRRVKFPRFLRGRIDTSAPARGFAQAYAQLAPSRL